jgi:hypothetical protein
MGHRLQVVDRVQLTVLVGWIVDPGHAATELKAQMGVVPEVSGEVGQMLPRHMKGDLTAVDDDLGDHVAEVGNQRTDPFIHLIPPATERRDRGSRELHNAGQTAIPRGIAAALDAEHAFTDLKHLGGRLSGG